MGRSAALCCANNVLAGITGSASGGMSIALKALGGDYLAMNTVVFPLFALFALAVVIALGTLFGSF